MFMKSNPLIVSILLILLIASSFASCKKMKENRLEGTWKFVSYSSSDQGQDRTWTFSNNGDFTETIVNNNTATTVTYTGTYVLRISSLKTFIEIFDVYINTDGKYRVVKLSGKLLKTIQITDRDGASQYIRKDFTKE